MKPSPWDLDVLVLAYPQINNYGKIVPLCIPQGCVYPGLRIVDLEE